MGTMKRPNTPPNDAATAPDDRTRRGRRATLLLSWTGLAVLLIGAFSGNLYRQGYHFRGLKPNEWGLRARGEYRHDPERFVVRQGAPDQPMVALTFDDGPSEHTPALLDALKAREAHATFFLVGANVVRRPELAQRMAAEGHDVANHTRTHLRLPPLREDQIANEIANGATVIRRATGERVRLFRPPGGQYDARVLAEAARQGEMTVLWSTNTGDWRARSPRWIANRVLSNVENGDIVLMHEARPETAAALPAILRALQERGFRLVTVSELMAASGYPFPDPQIPPVRQPPAD